MQYTPTKKKTRRITPVAVSTEAPLTAPPSSSSPGVVLDAVSPEKASVAQAGGGEEGTLSESRQENQQQASLLKFFPQQQDKVKGCTPSKDRPPQSKEGVRGGGIEEPDSNREVK